MISNKTLTTLLIIALLLLTYGCKTSHKMTNQIDEKQDWIFVKAEKSNTPTWIVYYRKLSGTNIYEYKIEGEVDATPDQCMNTFKQEIYDQAGNLNNKKFPTYNIIQETKDSILTYVIHKEPFPLKNTEMSVLYHFSKKGDSSRIVSWHEAWDVESAPPESKKLSRVSTFRGTWHFTPISGSSSKAINTVQFNPKKMPMWFVKPMVIKFLREGLEYQRSKVVKS